MNSSILKKKTFKSTKEKKRPIFQKEQSYETETRRTNKKYLVIVESPSKCSSIEKYLGEEYQCIASFGHIKTIKSLKSINMKGNFETKFDLIEKKRKHIEKMRTIISMFPKENIFLATDDDKEGCAIAYHIATEFGLSIETTKKITFNEITQNALQKAIEHPTTINKNTVKSQLARQILDMIIGFKISPVLWKHLYFSKTKCLSAGRCQTISLRLIYENHLLQKEKIQNKKYKITGSFFPQNILFHLNKQFEKKEEVFSFFEKSKTFQHTFCLGDKTDCYKSPPKPLNTASLLQIANNSLKISPKYTMDIAQKLYQMGYITYHRTENRKYSKEFLEKIKKYIVKKYSRETYIGNLDILENCDHINPHEAIRVTHIENADIQTDDRLVRALYKIIWRNTLMSCMSTAKYMHHLVSINAPDECQYMKTIEIPVFLGWMVVLKISTTSSCSNNTTRQDDETNDHLEEEELPPHQIEKFFHYLKIVNNKNVQYQSLDAVILETQKSFYYNESSLIQKLEDLQIGRPSTYHMFVETIKEKEYVKKMDVEGTTEMCYDISLKNAEIKETLVEKTFGKQKNKLIIQPLGILCIDFLLNHFEDIFSYHYTKQMEEELDLIENIDQQLLEETWYGVCEKTLSNITLMIKKTTQLKKPIYRLGENAELIFGKNGPVIKLKKEEEYEFLPVKQDFSIDLEKLKNGEYTFEMLACFPKSFLGMYEDSSLNLFVGQFGPYVKWGDNTKSLKNIQKPLSEITLEDVIKKVEEPEEEKLLSKNIIRVLNDEYSVRHGKWGFYIYYKKKESKTPVFISLKKCPLSFLHCEKDVLMEWAVVQNSKKKKTK